MIKIKYSAKPGEVVLNINGHANYAEHGQDIVCAGVSAIIQSAILGLEEIAKNYPDYVKIEGE